MKDLNAAISEFLTEENVELCKINRLYSKINTKLIFQYQNELEQTNLKIEQQIAEVKRCCNHCYRHIRELTFQNLRLTDELEKLTTATSNAYLESNKGKENKTGFKKGFLLETNRDNRRKKLHNNLKTLSESS